MMKHFKYYIHLLLASVVMSQTSFVTASAQNNAGSGTKDNPYIIATVDDLCKACQKVLAENAPNTIYFLQTADIDMAGVKNWFAINATYGNYEHAIVYDGGNHIIKNFAPDYVSDGGSQGYYNGSLFGVLTGKVMNLGVVDAKVDMKGENRTAGILGAYFGHGSVRDETYRTSVIENVFVTGEISCGNYNTGGLFGTTGSAVELHNCFANVKYSATGGNMGGMIGRVNHYTLMEHCYVAGTVNAEAGLVAGKGNGTLEADGLVVFNTGSSTVCGCTYYGDFIMANTSALRNAGIEEVRSWDAFSNTEMLNGYPALNSVVSGKGTKDEPYIIATAEDLANAYRYVDCINGGDYYFVQTADIDMAGVEDYHAMAGYNGMYNAILHYDGQNHLIKNFAPNDVQNIANTDYYYCTSVFGAVSGEIRNLGVVDAKIVNHSIGIGILGAYAGVQGNALQVENIFVSGEVECNSAYGGGLFGSTGGNVEIVNSYANVRVSGNANYIAGLIGRVRNNVTLENVYVAGAVSGTDYLALNSDKTSTVDCKNVIAFNTGASIAANPNIIMVGENITVATANTVSDLIAEFQAADDFNQGKTYKGFPALNWQEEIDAIPVDALHSSNLTLEWSGIPTGRCADANSARAGIGVNGKFYVAMPNNGVAVFGRNGLIKTIDNSNTWISINVDDAGNVYFRNDKGGWAGPEGAGYYLSENALFCVIDSKTDQVVKSDIPMAGAVKSRFDALPHVMGNLLNDFAEIPVAPWGIGNIGFEFLYNDLEQLPGVIQFDINSSLKQGGFPSSANTVQTLGMAQFYAPDADGMARKMAVLSNNQIEVTASSFGWGNNIACYEWDEVSESYKFANKWFNTPNHSSISGFCMFEYAGKNYIVYPAGMTDDGNPSGDGFYVMEEELLNTPKNATQTENPTAWANELQKAVAYKAPTEGLDSGNNYRGINVEPVEGEDGKFRIYLYCPGKSMQVWILDLKANNPEPFDRAIEGDYSIIIRDYYTTNSDYQELYDAVIENNNGNITINCDYFPYPVHAVYDENSGQITFTQMRMGQIDMQFIGKYYVRFEPFYCNPNPAQVSDREIILSDFTASYNVAEGSISFPEDYGFSWQLYVDSQYSQQYGHDNIHYRFYVDKLIKKGTSIPVHLAAPRISYDGRYATITAEEGAEVFMSLNTSNYIPYSGPFDVWRCTSIEAYAVKDGYLNSEHTFYQVTSYGGDLYAEIYNDGSLTEAYRWTDAATRDKILANPNFLLFADGSADVSGLGNITNLVVNHRAERIELSDRGEWFCPRDFYAAHVNFTRSFTKQTAINGGCAGWETIALPFDVDYISHGDTPLYSFAANSDGNAHRFWLYEPGSADWVEATDIEANKPYLIAMPDNPAYDEAYNIRGDVTFSADNVIIAETPYPLTYDYRDGYKITAHYNSVYNVLDDGKRLVVNDSVVAGALPGSVFVADHRAVRPFEAYLTAPGQNRVPIFHTTSVPEAMMAEMSLRVWTDTPQTVSIYAPFDAEVKVYDIAGRAVRTVNVAAGSTVRLADLPSGIYIIEKTKIAIRK